VGSSADELLELAAVVQLSQVAVAANVLIRDEDVRDSPLPRLLSQIGLNLRALRVLVEFDDADLVVKVELGDRLLRLLAVRAVRLGEDGDLLAADQVFCDLLGRRHGVYG